MAPDDGTDRADAITRVLAQRIAKLRKDAGLNQAELGARMAKLRPNWSRSTVVKLETYKRESLSVGDLLALALVFDVPPVTLIADPRQPASIPIGASNVDAWNALLWLVGGVHLDGQRPFDVGADDAHLTAAAWEVSAALRTLTTVRAGIPGLAGFNEVNEQRHREALDRLGVALVQINNEGWPLPPMPEVVLLRAAELGVELPFVELPDADEG